MLSINDCAKDGGEGLLPRCTAFYTRIPIESSKIRDSNAKHLGNELLAVIFSAIVYQILDQDECGNDKVQIQSKSEI